VDWFTWIPGREELLVRAGGTLRRVDPADGGNRVLGEAGPPEAPVPALSFSGEYVAAVDARGYGRVLRLGSEGGSWVPLDPGRRTDAIAFSPAGPVLAYALDDGTVHLDDLERRTSRELARAEARLTDLHWSPRGDALTWDTVSTDGKALWSGGAAVTPGGAPPPRPGSTPEFALLGPPQWSPDGVSLLAPARHRGKEGLWRLEGTVPSELTEARIGADPEVLTAPDFLSVAFTIAPAPTPRASASTGSPPSPGRPIPAS